MFDILQFSGGEVLGYVEDLVCLCIQVFCEYFYLYDGDMAYEVVYVDIFLQAQQNFMVVVKDGDIVVGVSIGLFFVEEIDNIKVFFLEVGWDIIKIFYFGELVLLLEYWGKGYGK